MKHDITDPECWKYERRTDGPGITGVTVIATFGQGDEAVGFEVCDDDPEGSSGVEYPCSVVNAAIALYRSPR